MTALAQERGPKIETWAGNDYTLASGHKAYKGAAIGLDLATGKVKPMESATGLFYLGHAEDTIDATSADKTLTVRFLVPIWGSWYANDDSTAVVATDVGDFCYFKDDQTVSADATSRSVAGRVWAVDSAKGVFVEKMQAIPDDDVTALNADIDTAQADIVTLQAEVAATTADTQTYTKASAGVNTLIAANATYDREVSGMLKCTVSLDDGDGAQPTFKVGYTSADDDFVAIAEVTDATAGTKIPFAGALPATKALIVTVGAGTGATQAGTVKVTALCIISD